MDDNDDDDDDDNNDDDNDDDNDYDVLPAATILVNCISCFLPSTCQLVSVCVAVIDRLIERQRL